MPQHWAIATLTRDCNSTPYAWSTFSPPVCLVGAHRPFLFIHQKAASFQVLDDIASLRQGIASIAMNAGSVGNALQAVAGLTQQLVPGVNSLPLIVPGGVR